MKTQNTICSPSTGAPIPIVAIYERKPLMYCGKPVINGNGKQLMDDEWAYVGNHSINTVRADYCIMLHLKMVSIQSAIGENKLMSKRLKDFCENISDKLVFNRHGQTYRIFLKKITSRTFDIKKISPYWATTCKGSNIPIMSNNKFMMWAHELDVTSKFV